MRGKGFLGFGPEEHRRISSMGGKISSMERKGHKWTREEASVAGKKGAEKRWAKHRRKKHDLES